MFLLVTKTMPLDLGFSGSCECMKWRFGWYCEFSFLICSSSECDSRTLSTAIFLDSILLMIIFHLSQVATLLAPLTLRVAIMMEPACVGLGGFPPLSHRGLCGCMGGRRGQAGTQWGARLWLISTSQSLISWVMASTMGSLMRWRSGPFTAEHFPCCLYRGLSLIFVVVRLLLILQL